MATNYYDCNQTVDYGDGKGPRIYAGYYLTNASESSTFTPFHGVEVKKAYEHTIRTLLSHFTKNEGTIDDIIVFAAMAYGADTEAEKEWGEELLLARLKEATLTGTIAVEMLEYIVDLCMAIAWPKDDLPAAEGTPPVAAKDRIGDPCYYHHGSACPDWKRGFLRVWLAFNSSLLAPLVIVEDAADGSCHTVFITNLNFGEHPPS